MRCENHTTVHGLLRHILGLCHGLFIDGMPTICGGSDGPSSKSSCWGYSLATDSWSEVGQMPEPKSGMGRDFEQQWGIIMAGGEAVQNFTDYQAQATFSKSFLWNEAKSVAGKIWLLLHV